MKICGTITMILCNCYTLGYLCPHKAASIARRLPGIGRRAGDIYLKERIWLYMHLIGHLTTH